MFIISLPYLGHTKQSTKYKNNPHVQGAHTQNNTTWYRAIQVVQLHQTTYQVVKKEKLPDYAHKDDFTNDDRITKKMASCA